MDKQAIAAFFKYVEEWRDLERAYYRIPSWRVFKQLRNIKKRERLTTLYVARMKRWGIIE